jgi:DNA-binding CsgD family transcriptional regulator/tetratricopeptide (TPR) repeat protein
VTAGLTDLESARDLAHGDHRALLRCLVYASDLMFLLGRHDDALRIAEEGLARARERGVEHTSGMILASNAVDPLLARGQWDQADELIDRMLTFEAPLAYRLYLHLLRIWLMLWRGDVSGAGLLFGRWRSSMVTLAGVEMQSRLGVARVAGELAVARGDLTSAWEQAEVLLSQDRPLPGHDLPLLCLGARVVGAFRRTGGPGCDERGLAAREHRLRTLLAKVSFWPTAPLWTALFDAELGGPAHDGSDIDQWQRAADAMRAPEARAYLRPYALFRLGEARLAAGDRTGATADLRATVAAADTIGAGLVRGWATQTAALAGLSLEAGPVRAQANGSMLTPRERQVLKLIARGLTNRQIGERLFISPKTASVHVSAILRKLGASSRTEAVFLGDEADRSPQR